MKKQNNMSYYSFECPRCKFELTAEVDIGDHMVEWGEECDECGYKFTREEILKIYDNALTDGLGTLIDYAHDALKDRYI